MEIELWQLYAAALVFGVVIIGMLAWVMHSKDNTIEWWHFISSRGADGRQYADLTKLGQVAGILLCIAVTFIFAARKDTTAEGFSFLFGVVLVYLGGVQAYQTYVKSKKTPTVASVDTEKEEK